MVEIRRILEAVPGLRLIDLDSADIMKDPAEEELEPYETFEETRARRRNTSTPSRAWRRSRTTRALAVDALGGAPGVRSKRFAPDRGLNGEELDQANNDHLMAQLDDLDLAAPNWPLRVRGRARRSHRSPSCCSRRGRGPYPWPATGPRRVRLRPVFLRSPNRKDVRRARYRGTRTSVVIAGRPSGRWPTS